MQKNTVPNIRMKILSQKREKHGRVPSAVLKDSQVFVARSAAPRDGCVLNAVNGMPEMYVRAAKHLSQLKMLKKAGHALNAIIHATTEKCAGTVAHQSQNCRLGSVRTAEEKEIHMRNARNAAFPIGTYTTLWQLIFMILCGFRSCLMSERKKEDEAFNRLLKDASRVFGVGIL